MQKTVFLLLKNNWKNRYVKECCILRAVKFLFGKLSESQLLTFFVWRYLYLKLQHNSQVLYHATMQDFYWHVEVSVGDNVDT
jgi:hypothetical protein